MMNENDTKPFSTLIDGLMYYRANVMTQMSYIQIG